MSTILVTGAAGFIGLWTCEGLLAAGHQVVGIDNFNSYYDPKLKRARAKRLEGKVRIHELDISDGKAVDAVFKQHKFDKVCHLAGQAGVRYSLDNPNVYEVSNNAGTLSLLEACRHNKVNTFVFSSSSSVYGGNKKVPFSVSDPVDHPISLYAATKKYNELLGYTYHHLYGIHFTALRFFTVYGPWGRPDMSPYKFTDAIAHDKPIDLYNHGKMKRDFTYVSDIVDGVKSALDKSFPYEILNLGNSSPVDLEYYVGCIEKELGKKAQRNLLPMQPGDVLDTYADIDLSRQKLGFSPKVKIEEGVREFVAWYKKYNGI